MNRQIKFRGQRENTKEWIYGSLLDEDRIVGKVIDWNEDYFNTEYWWRVIPETVCQFTGLYDKKGIEIYEGDIVRWGYAYDANHLRIAIVKINPDIQLHCLNLEDYNGNQKVFRWGNFAYKNIFDKDGEVLGNIYDNGQTFPSASKIVIK